MAERRFGRHIFGVKNLDVELIVPFPAPSPQVSATGVTENAVQTVFKTAVFLGSFILVAVLMAVLICLARWEFIVKCLNWRRGHSTNEDLESPQQAEPKSEMMGLSKQQINSVPVLRYKESGPDLHVSQKFGTECSICLSEFDDGERIRVLPRCGHAFHVLCIDTWLRSHASCPSCRHSLLDKRSNSGKFRNLYPS